MFLYFLSKRLGLGHMKAAVELMKELYGAECRGSAPWNTGLVYATEVEIPEDEQKILGIIPFL